MPLLTFAQHATQARAIAKRFGLVDCMHYAPNACARVDALYAILNASGVAWYSDDIGIGLLPDGRMAVICQNIGVAEPKTK